MIVSEVFLREKEGEFVRDDLFETILNFYILSMLRLWEQARSEENVYGVVHASWKASDNLLQILQQEHEIWILLTTEKIDEKRSQWLSQYFARKTLP